MCRVLPRTPAFWGQGSGPQGRVRARARACVRPGGGERVLRLPHRPPQTLRAGAGQGRGPHRAPCPCARGARPPRGERPPARCGPGRRGSAEARTSCHGSARPAVSSHHVRGAGPASPPLTMGVPAGVLPLGYLSPSSPSPASARPPRSSAGACVRSGRSRPRGGGGQRRAPRSRKLAVSSRAPGARAPASGASGPTGGLGRAGPGGGAAGPSAAAGGTPLRTRGGLGRSGPGRRREDGGGRLRAAPGLAHAGRPGRAAGLGAPGPRAVRRDPGPGRLRVGASRPGRPSAGGRGRGPAAREEFREVRPQLPLPPAGGLRRR